MPAANGVLGFAVQRSPRPNLLGSGDRPLQIASGSQSPRLGQKGLILEPLELALPIVNAGAGLAVEHSTLAHTASFGDRRLVGLRCATLGQTLGALQERGIFLSLNRIGPALHQLLGFVPAGVGFGDERDFGDRRH